MRNHSKHPNNNQISEESLREFLQNAPVGQMQVLRIRASDGIVREFYGPSFRQDATPTEQNDPLNEIYITHVSFGPEISLRQVLFLLSYRPMDHETCN